MRADSITDPGAGMSCRVRSNSTNIKTYTINIVREEWKRVSIEFTLTESIEGFNFAIQPIGGASKVNNLNMQIKNIQLEKSDTMTEYEPFGKYKIPIKMSGKNLFDINNFQQGANSNENISAKIKTTENGELSFGGLYGVATGAGIAIPLEPGETICISWERVSGDYRGSLMYGADLNSNGVYAKWKYGRDSVENATSIKITQIEGYNYINFSIANISGRYRAKIKNLQIEKSDSVTKYEPYIEPITTNIYLDEPLGRCGDNYTDYIDSKSKEFVKSSNIRKFTGDEAWYMSGSAFALANWDDKLTPVHKSTEHYNEMSFYSNIASRVINNTSYGFRTHNYQGVDWILFYPTESITTLEEWKDFLANNDVYVMFPLATPIAKPIVLPKLPTVKGTTIYTIETTVQPSNMSAEYYSTSKGE
jgi:hypothetical protein